MNRADRRLAKQYEKQQNKIKRNFIQKNLNMYESPCAYANSVPLYCGSCVFLKPDNEIEGQYDWQLNKLIDKNHRFVILQHLGPKKGVVVISLLSTSSYLNEENKLGIRLNGQYHKNKYVYMDARNCWVVDSNCIKSLDYNLTYEDRVRCLLVSANNKLDKVSVHKGLLDNETVNKYIDYFEFMFNHKFEEEHQEDIDCVNVKCYVSKLSYSQVVDMLKEKYSKDRQLVNTAIKVIDEEYPDEYFDSIEEYHREILTLYLCYTDKIEKTEISKYMQVGY